MSKFNQTEYKQLCDTVDWFFNHGMDFAHSCVISSHILPQDDLGNAVGLVTEYLEHSWPEKVSMGWIVLPKGEFKVRIKQDKGTNE